MLTQLLSLKRFYKKWQMDKILKHILVVDDDDGIRSLVKQYLISKNFLVTTAANAIEAEKKLNLIKFDIIILDVMMPGKTGYELTKQLKTNASVPIILLTARGEVKDRIKGLELGADDYLGKPFEPRELLLRINNILNKTFKKSLSLKISLGKIELNLKKMEIKKNNKIIKINSSEKEILNHMLKSPGKIFSRDDIGKITNLSKERTVDVLITRLRQKIENDPKNPKYLQTIRGSGYVLWMD